MQGKDSVLFSSNSDDWTTPQDLFDKLDVEFHFGLDAAANEYNTKAFYYCNDGLNESWLIPEEDENYTPVFLNPPYSQISAFMKKAYEESLKGAVVVCLIPVRSDTRYWHDYVMKAHEIRLIKGRLKFGCSKNSAPFASCIVIFDYGKYDKNNDPIFKTVIV